MVSYLAGIWQTGAAKRADNRFNGKAASLSGCPAISPLL
jgi:hypothetical protein